LSVGIALLGIAVKTPVPRQTERHGPRQCALVQPDYTPPRPRQRMSAPTLDSRKDWPKRGLAGLVDLFLSSRITYYPPLHHRLIHCFCCVASAPFLSESDGKAHHQSTASAKSSRRVSVDGRQAFCSPTLSGACGRRIGLFLNRAAPPIIFLQKKSRQFLIVCASRLPGRTRVTGINTVAELIAIAYPWRFDLDEEGESFLETLHKTAPTGLTMRPLRRLVGICRAFEGLDLPHDIDPPEDVRAQEEKYLVSAPFASAPLGEGRV